jgi:DNA-binding FadR family transcriptional regulator
VREALIALEIEGKVEVPVGSGVYVAPPHPVAVPARDVGEVPFELIRARRAIEGEVAMLAAGEASDDDRHEIQAAHDELLAAQTGNLSTEAVDRRFHVAIARATHNGPLEGVVARLWDQGRGALWQVMEKHFSTPALKAATLKDHRAILKTILGGDGAGARKAMHAHLDRVAREFAKGWELSKKKKPDRAAVHRKRALP